MRFVLRRNIWRGEILSVVNWASIYWLLLRYSFQRIQIGDLISSPCLQDTRNSSPSLPIKWTRRFGALWRTGTHFYKTCEHFLSYGHQEQCDRSTDKYMAQGHKIWHAITDWCEISWFLYAIQTRMVSKQFIRDEMSHFEVVFRYKSSLEQNDTFFVLNTLSANRQSGHFMEWTVQIRTTHI